MSVLLDPTTAVLMLSVLISRDHTSVLVTLDILEMDVIVWVNVFQTNVVPFLWNLKYSGDNNSEIPCLWLTMRIANQRVMFGMGECVRV